MNTTSHLEKPVVAALVEALGDSCVLLGDDVTSRGAGIWRSDNIAAQVLVRPRTTEEVSTALSICHKYQQPVVTHGGLTGLVEGAITTDADVVLSTERMNQIESINPDERLMVVQSGVVLQTLQEAAAEHGLMFPLDLGGRGTCTIGGNISTNAGGNRVIRYGMTRDMVLGLEAVLADGTVISSMNHMIKNNAGYDLKQLFMGTEGTLGVVTRAVLRCRAEPLSQPTLMVGVESFTNLVAVLKEADRQLQGTLSAFEVMWNNYYSLVTTPPAPNSPPMASTYPYYVLIEAIGASDELVGEVFGELYGKGLVADVVLAQSEQQRLQLWGIRDAVDQAMNLGPVFLFDVSLRIPLMQTYVEEVDAGLQAQFPNVQNFVLGHMGDGNLHFAIHVGDGSEQARRKVEACVYEPLASRGGSVSAEHGVGLEKKPYLHIARDQAEVQLMRTLKQALDPLNLLNRGKIFEWSE